jgi:hypothetical protein
MKWSTKVVCKGSHKFERPKKPDGTLIQPPPCKECPKKSPEEAPGYELTLGNWQAYQFYLRVRATNGAILTDRMKDDEILLSNLAAIDSIMRAHATASGAGGL